MHCSCAPPGAAADTNNAKSSSKHRPASTTLTRGDCAPSSPGGAFSSTCSSGGSRSAAGVPCGPAWLPFRLPTFSSEGSVLHMLRHLSFRSTCERSAPTTLDVVPAFRRKARVCMMTRFGAASLQGHQQQQQHAPDCGARAVRRAVGSVTSTPRRHGHSDEQARAGAPPPADGHIACQFCFASDTVGCTDGGLPRCA